MNTKRPSPSSQTTYEAALNTALRLLKIRCRSEHELRHRLAIKGWSQEIIDKVVQQLKEWGEIDDRLFAQTWAEQRRRRGWGRYRIEHELKQKGVAPDLIKASLPKTDDEETLAALIDLLSQRKHLYESLSQDKMRVRLYHYALRRGHAPAQIIKALQAVC